LERYFAEESTPRGNCLVGELGNEAARRCGPPSRLGTKTTCSVKAPITRTILLAPTDIPTLFAPINKSLKRHNYVNR